MEEGLENPPGFTNVGDKKQPKPAVSLYDFNLPQALDIWKDAGCTEGSKKPTDSNDHWRYEGWKDEVIHYKKEADKYFNEHNYYDWVGNISGEQVIKNKNDENSFPIGIGEARKRCHDGGFDANYIYPKIGDRVKKKKHPTTDKKKSMKGDYYVGTVFDADQWGDNVKVMWDALGTDRSTAPDTKRLVTKNLPPEISKAHSKYNKLTYDNNKFGWPKLKWGRMPERGVNNYEQTNAKKVNWIKGDANNMINKKELYKIEECKQDDQTECDYLKCGKRKKTAIANYPITYICNGDIRNTSDDKWYCQKNGTVSTYYNKGTMCKKFLKTGKPLTYCNEKCGGNSSCIPYKSGYHQKNITYRGKKCIAEVTGKDTEGLIRKAILPDMKKYTKSSIKNTHGFSSIDNVKIHGKSRCRILKNGSKSGSRNTNGSFNSIEIKEIDPQVKLYTKIGGRNYALKAHPVSGIPRKQYQIYGVKKMHGTYERNAIWVDTRWGGETFTWKNGKLCTISPTKCCLEWDAEKGPGSESAKGIGRKERNAKFDCRSGGNKFKYSGGKIKPTTGAGKKCTMEWSSKKFDTVTEYRGKRKYGWLKTRQGKFDCGGGGDHIRMVYQN